MSHNAASFYADLRYPVPDARGDRWSLWKSLPMIELSARDIYRFVKAALPSSAQRILEIGCGDGYLALELARDGYDVIGIDQSREAIEVAERTRAAHPPSQGPGKLRYYCTDVHSWQITEQFDAVIIARALHHLPDLQKTMGCIRRLLASNGYLICQDYAYDRLSEQTAAWLYTMQSMLYLTGMADDSPARASAEAQAIKALRAAWFERAASRLKRYDEMLQALEQNFQQQMFAWVPYLFVYIGNGICHATPEREEALLTFLKRMEQYHIEKGHIQAVGFRYVGRL